MTGWTRVAASSARRTTVRAKRARQRVRSGATGEFRKVDITETPDRESRRIDISETPDRDATVKV